MNGATCAMRSGPRIARWRSAGAYTLLEMMIAVIMFALISVATAMMITAGLRGQAQIGSKVREAQEVRTLLSVLTRDLRGVFVVSGSPATYFVSSGADSGPVLQFTTLAPRLNPDLVGESLTAAADTENLVPQSDVLQVTYDYDPNTHVLSRLVSRLPGLDTIPEAGDPGWILSRRVAYVSLVFYDASGNMRNEWNYQSPATDATSGEQVDVSSYDTTLPARIDVELELDRADGDTIVVRASVVPANSAAQPAGQRPAAAQQTGNTGGGAGGGGGGGAGGGGGSGGP